MSTKKQQDAFNLTDLSAALPAAASGLSAEDCAGLVNTLMDKLQILAGKHDVMENLSEKVRKRVEALKEIQIEDGPSGVGQEHGNITRYEDLRMDVEPPMEFDFMTYQGSLPSSQHEMSYVTQMEDVNDPLLELDWRLSLPDVVGDGCEFKQCVWCGREFYHDSLSSQLQPNMIGLICPACKENT